MTNRRSGIRIIQHPTVSEEDFNLLFGEEDEEVAPNQTTKEIKKLLEDKEKSKGSYKGILYNLKDALSIAMTTQDEHDKEIYKRIYDYITERMREVDESRKENE